MLLLGGLVAGPLLAALFLFGCCVLPFHASIHRVAPLCQVAAGILSGSGRDPNAVNHPIAPAPGKSKVAAFDSMLAPRSLAFANTFGVDGVNAFRSVLARTGNRRWLSLGAARCDDDVGLQLLLTTFRI